ncbi:MAG TPA: 6-pyruvoyl-tetrahydropterin synthase-related protein, partial [Fibrobacteria bacterium]|nr:6-pyruvoyl-tetrahydropterin synthase-related protein [Fibrobacteria bacterium]
MRPSSKRSSSSDRKPAPSPVPPPVAKAPSGDRGLAFAIALGVWGVALWVLQFTTLAKMSQLLNPNFDVATFSGFTPYLFNARSPVRLEGLDTLLLIALAGIPVFLLYLQARHRAMAGAWHLLAGTPWKKAIFLTVLFGTLSRFALHPGAFSNLGDGPVFIAGAEEFRRSLAMGAFPDYSTLFYSGWNPRQYIGNLFSVFAGTFAYVFGSTLIGIKVFLLVAHALSGVGMFLWMERLTKSRRVALFAAVAYALSLWHVHQIFLMGRYHLSILYACMPWAFLFLDWSLEDRARRLRHLLLATVPLAASMYIHFVWGTMLWSACTVYAAARIWTGTARGERPRALTSLFIAFALQGLIFAGLLSAPFVRKHESYAHYSTSSVEVLPSQPGDRVVPAVLYQWSNGHWSVGGRPELSWYNTYLGIVPLAFALFGFAAFSRRRSKDPWAPRILGVFLACNLALVFLYHTITELPGLKMFRIFPEHRYQTFLVFFLAACAAFGVRLWDRGVSGRFTGWRANLLLALPLVLLALDVGTTSFQIPSGNYMPWQETPLFDKYRADGRAYLKRKENVPYLLFVEGRGLYDYNLRLPSLQADMLGMPSDLGVQPQTAPRSSKFGETFYAGLADRMKSAAALPDSFSLDYFYLHNFRDVMLRWDSTRTYDNTVMDSLATDGYYLRGELIHHSPIVAATIAEPYAWKNESDAEELRRHYASMHLDYANRTAEKIFLQPGSA